MDDPLDGALCGKLFNARQGEKIEFEVGMLFSYINAFRDALRE